MKKLIISLSAMAIALGASAQETYYWIGTSTSGTLATNWSDSSTGSPTRTSMFTFDSTDTYKYASSVTAKKAGGLGAGSGHYGTFYNDSAYDMEFYWSGNSTFTVEGMESRGSRQLILRAQSTITAMNLTVNNITATGGTIVTGTSGAGIKSFTLGNSATLSGGASWTAYLGYLNKYDAGTFTSTGKTITLDGASVLIGNGTNISGDAAATAVVGNVVMKGSAQNKFRLGGSTAASVLAYSIDSLTSKGADDILEVFTQQENGGTITTVNLEAKDNAVSLKITGNSTPLDVNIGTLNVSGEFSSSLTNGTNAQNYVIDKIAMTDAKSRLILATTKDISVGELSFVLGTTGNSDALITISAATFGKIEDPISIDFTGGSASETYVLLTSDKVLDLDDFSIDSSLGSLSLSDDGKTLSFTAAIPEPATYALIAGALGLAFAAYRKRRN